MLGGFLTSVGWVMFLKSQTYNLYEMIPGFLVGLALTIIVSRLGKSAPESGSSHDYLRSADQHAM